MQAAGRTTRGAGSADETDGRVAGREVLVAEVRGAAGAQSRRCRRSERVSVQYGRALPSHARPRRRRVARHTHVMPSWVKATMSENICTSNRRTRQPRAAASRRPQSLCAARARLRAVGARRTPSRCRVPAPRWCVDQNSNRAVWLKVYRGPWTKIKNKKRFSSSSCGVGQEQDGGERARRRQHAARKGEIAR